MTTNINKDVLRDYTDRVARMLIEKKERDDEHKEDIKEIKLEVKGRLEETGVDADLVMFCAKTRMQELEARMKLMTEVSSMDVYDSIYGVNVDINKLGEEASSEEEASDDTEVDPLG